MSTSDDSLQPEQRPEPIEATYSLAEMRAKWERYGERLKGGDDGGSLLGAAYIIARSGCTDVVELLDRLALAQAVVKAAETHQAAIAEWVGHHPDDPIYPWPALDIALSALRESETE